MVADLAKQFRVSNLVILRRPHDAGAISLSKFKKQYEQAIKDWWQRKSGTGGDFYRTRRLKLGRRFACAVIRSAQKGQTLYRDAYHLLGVKSDTQLRRLANEVEATP